MPRTKALQFRISKSIYFDDNYGNVFSQKCTKTQEEVNRTKNLVIQEYVIAINIKGLSTI